MTRSRQRGAQAGARGVRRGARRAPPDEQGMVLLDRNWRCDAGEIDLVLRDGRVLVVCEVKTRSSDGLRHPARGGRPSARPPGCAGSRPAGSSEHAVRPDEVRLDLVGVLAPARAAARRSTTCGGRLMSFATAARSRWPARPGT